MSSFGYEYNPSDGAGYGFGDYNQMGAGMNFGDAGFMTDSANQGSAKKEGGAGQSILPLSIKQIKGMKEEKIDGLEVDKVKIVGIVAADSVNESETNIQFKVNDSTGEFECRAWINKAEPKADVKPLSLVEVYGSLKEYQGSPHINVFEVREVKDWNVITYHMLDVILTHCQNTKNTTNHQAGGMTIGNTPMRGGMDSKGLMGSGQRIQNVSASDDLEEKVMRAYHDHAYSDIGLNYDQALQALGQTGTNIDMNRLKGIIMKLCDDGRLYTTVDESTFKSTDS